MIPKQLVTGLLHDVIEDTVFKEQLNEIFGKSIASLVDGLTKIDFLEKKNYTIRKRGRKFSKIINFNSKRYQSFNNQIS